MENQSTHTLKSLFSWFPTFFTVLFLLSYQYLFLVPAFMLFLCFLSVAFPFPFPHFLPPLCVVASSPATLATSLSQCSQMGKPSWLFQISFLTLPPPHTPYPSTPSPHTCPKVGLLPLPLCLLMSPVPFCVPYYSNWECHHYSVTHHKRGGWDHSEPSHLPHPSHLVTVLSDLLGISPLCPEFPGSPSIPSFLCSKG